MDKLRYEIVCAPVNNTYILEQKVRRLVAQGYTMLGGVTASHGMLYQAMWRSGEAREEATDAQD